MHPDRTCLLLSIRPPFADAIFAGSKRVELRRTRPKVRPGDLVLVYVTSPHQELRGVLRVVRVEEAEPAEFWPQVREDAGIGKEHFDAYFAGASNAFGIHFDAVHPFSQPVTAGELREGGWPHFQAPQSYRYLRTDEIELLGSLLDMELWDHLPSTGCETGEPFTLEA